MNYRLISIGFLIVQLKKMIVEFSKEEKLESVVRKLGGVVNDLEDEWENLCEEERIN